MTKVTILGQSHEDVKPKKKIEFVKYLVVDLVFEKITNEQDAKHWDNVVLLTKDFTYDGLDLMYAYDNDGLHSLLVLGHFNDGVV